MKTTIFALTVSLFAPLLACSSEADDGSLSRSKSQAGDSPVAATPAPAGSTHHEGPQEAALPTAAAEVSARLHGCGKIQYATLGKMLSSRGVDLSSSSQTAAARLYATGAQALGVANFTGRVGEAALPTTASTAKLFDILVAAAPEIQANLKNSRACPGTELMLEGAFTREGVSCLLGKPAKDEHLMLANRMIGEATDPTTGARLAIAALLEAAHTCE